MQQPSRRSISLLLAMGALALGYIGCHHDNEDQTFSRHTLREWINADAFPQRVGSPRPLDDLVLYLDSSGSMRGYTDPAGQFEYSRSLRAVRDVVDQLKPKHSLLFRRIDTAINSLPTNEQTLLAASRSPGFYSGTSSNIASAIRSFNSFDNDKNTKLARCHILITDGVQDLSGGTQDARCASGSDPRCVNTAVSELIDQGWGVHIFGIRSRFNGPIYSEARGGQLIGNYNATGPAEHSHYRPFFLFVFTRESEYLEHLVDKLRGALRKSGIDADLIRELPLTLPLVQSSSLILNTKIYSIKDELRAGELVPNPLFHRTDWREDFDGTPLPDYAQILEYTYNDLNFLQPLAVNVSATIDLTTSGEILFGKTAIDAGGLLKPVTAREVPRPNSWYGPEGKEAPAPSPPVGSTNSPANEVENKTKSGAAPTEKVGSQKIVTWPPTGTELKRLQFETNLQRKTPDFMVLKAEDKLMTCSLNGGCHLVLRWSQSGDYLPITLIRIDGLLDPAKILLPKWIEEWSTEDDSRLSTANRIFNLETLVHGLQENEHIAKQGLRPWYLVIWPTKQR